MKKRISLFLATAAAAVLLTSCGSSGTYGKYVTLGEYKGLSVNMIRSEVSDDTLQDEIDSVIQEHAQYDPITDRACENGDVVNIDFTGTIDGAEFDDGSATDYDLELGEGYFIDELEEGIAGMKTGETKEIPVTFPEDYNEDLAGKEAVFSERKDDRRRRALQNGEKGNYRLRLRERGQILRGAFLFRAGLGGRGKGAA